MSILAGNTTIVECKLTELLHANLEIYQHVMAIINNVGYQQVAFFLGDSKYNPDVDGITARTIKAGFLILESKVKSGRKFEEYGSYINELARVEGSKGEEYAVCWNVEANGCTCDCPDFSYSRAPLLASGQRACKHILAVLVAESMKEDDHAF